MTMRAAILSHGLLACSLIAKQFRATTHYRTFLHPSRQPQPGQPTGHNG
jgi:hypothetical protein